MAHTCPYCTEGQAGGGQDKCQLLMAAYILAGLAMMLNIRLSYSSAPYALIRFKLPENLFSVFVRRMASALELWCLPSMLLGNIVELALKGYYKSQGYEADWNNNGNLKHTGSGKPTYSTVILITDKTIKEITIKNLPHINDTDDLITPRQLKFWFIIWPSIISQWLNFLTYVILFFVYVIGDDQGHLTLFYLVIAISGFVFGINMVLVYAADWNYTPVYIVGENSFPIVTSFMHYLSTLMFGNRRKWNSDFIIVMIDIWVAIVISFVAAVVWTIAYGIFIDTQTKSGTTYHNATTTTGFPPNLTAQDITNITVTDNKGNAIAIYNKVKGPAATTPSPDTLGLTITKDGKGEVTATTFIKQGEANPGASAKGTPNTIILTTTLTGPRGANIEITGKPTTAPVIFGHIFTETFDTSKVRVAIISPTLMVIVGMGLVYAIYPGIAPGMIVPFYLVDKIEMVLLIATFFPPVIVALLNRGQFGESTKPYSPKTAYQGHDSDSGMGGWLRYKKHIKLERGYGCDIAKETEYIDAWFWHLFDLLIVIKISLAAIFIYSLHYRDSSLSRSIINQPKMSTVLSIIFYMCHEILLALGFAGVIGNNGGTYVVLPAQYVGALFMIFLAFYSEGYIIEYKSHDPAHWPTEGMNPWNGFCYWTKRAVEITNKFPNHVLTIMVAILLKLYKKHNKLVYK
uniref:Theileria-specific sub-telomeric protein, putative n=1 Tax=Theileria annulata TaxID=5874 RepID=A0A3B0MLH7_THEAN